MKQDKVVVVTGAAKRVGRELAIHLAKQGYRVIVHCNTSLEDATKVQQELKALSCKSQVVQGDLTDLDDLGTLFARFVEPFGQVDAIINSASVFSNVPLEKTTVQGWRSDMALHAGAPFFLSKALYQHIKERGTTGAVINITDTQVSCPPANRPSYYLSKATLAEETRILARNLAPFVRVNTVAPGLVLSNGEDDFFTRMATVLPLQRCGSPSDVCEAVSYLLSASFVTGITLTVDGGHHLL